MPFFQWKTKALLSFLLFVNDSNTATSSTTADADGSSWLSAVASVDDRNIFEHSRQKLSEVEPEVASPAQSNVEDDGYDDDSRFEDGTTTTTTTTIGNPTPPPTPPSEVEASASIIAQQQQQQQYVVVYTDRTAWENAMRSEGYTIVENDFFPALGGRDTRRLPDGSTNVGRFAVKLSAQGSIRNWLWVDSNDRGNYEGRFSTSVDLKFHDLTGATLCGFAGMWKQYSDGSAGDFRIRVGPSGSAEVDMSRLIKANGLNNSRFIGFVATDGFDELRFLTSSSNSKFNVRRVFMSTSCGRAPTPSPTPNPTTSPTKSPTDEPTLTPSASPTVSPSVSPTATPSVSPTVTPSVSPSVSPTETPSVSPSVSPTDVPSLDPSGSPSLSHNPSLSVAPSKNPSLSLNPSGVPSDVPSFAPSDVPSDVPSLVPSDAPSVVPSLSIAPSSSPTTTIAPSAAPSATPTDAPSVAPTTPTSAPTATPTTSTAPTNEPSVAPSATPTTEPWWTTPVQVTATFLLALCNAF